MDRGDVEQRLIRRHPAVPAGVVLTAVARSTRHPRRASYAWSEIEQVADEQLLLRQTLRRGSP